MANTSRKRDLRVLVSERLEQVFKDFEEVLGKRKFRRNIKKAAKVLTSNVKPSKINRKVSQPAPDTLHDLSPNATVKNNGEQASVISGHE